MHNNILVKGIFVSFYAETARRCQLLFYRAVFFYLYIEWFGFGLLPAAR